MRWLVALAGVALLVTAHRANAAFAANDTSWEGGSELLALCRERLGEDRVKLAATLDFDALEPGDGVLILHPKVELDYTEISSFLRAGGRLALIDDFGEGSKLLDRFQIRRIQAPLRPERAMRENPSLAIAVPSVEMVAGHEQGRHPVVARVTEVVTNHPSGLVHPNLTPVLEIPAVGQAPVALAVTGIIVDRGRLFAMADPSALMNLMLRYPGNRAFAEGLIDYLLEDDAWGKRGGTLYFLTNDFRQRGSFAGESQLRSELAEYVDTVSDALRRAREQGIPELLALLMAVATTGLALAWALQHALRRYRRPLPRYAAPVPLVGQGGVAGRAAVLAAPTTHRALVLLELKSGLEEALAHRLGLDEKVAPSVLLAEMERQQLLDRPSRENLAGLLERLGKIEAAVLARRPPTIRQRELVELRKRALGVLSRLEISTAGVESPERGRAP